MIIFINMTIIKQNNMTYQHKIIFYIWDRFVYGFAVGSYIFVTSCMCFEIGEKPYPYKLSQNRKNLSNWVWFGWVTTSSCLIDTLNKIFISSCYTFSQIIGTK